MKILGYLGCLVFGHNKVLENWIEGGYRTYYSVCTQCERRWHQKELSEKPRRVIKTHSFKMIGQGQKIQIKKVPKIIQQKKLLVNFYVI
jgi:hypothetical protein